MAGLEGTNAMDKRRYERVGFLCRVVLAALPNGPHSEGRATDLSLGGAGILTPCTLRRGRPSAVTFFLRDRSQKEVKSQVVGRVVNLRADVDVNRIGVEFLEPLNEVKHPTLVKRLLEV